MAEYFRNPTLGSSLRVPRADRSRPLQTLTTNRQPLLGAPTVPFSKGVSRLANRNDRLMVMSRVDNNFKEHSIPRSSPPPQGGRSTQRRRNTYFNVVITNEVYTKSDCTLQHSFQLKYPAL